MCNSHSEIIYSNARWTLWNSFQINYMTTLPKEHMEKIFLRNYFTNKTIVMNKYQNSYFYETHIFSLLLCECVCIRLNNNFEKTEEKTKYTMRNLIHYRKVNKHASVLYIYVWVGGCLCVWVWVCARTLIRERIASLQHLIKTDVLLGWKAVTFDLGFHPSKTDKI